MHLGMPPRPPSTWLGGKIRQETAVKKTPPLQNGSVKGQRGFGGAVFRKCTLTAPATCYLDNLSFRKIQTSPHMLSYEAIPGGAACSFTCLQRSTWLDSSSARYGTAFERSLAWATVHGSVLCLLLQFTRTKHLIAL